MFLPEPIEEEKLNILFLKYQNGDIESRNIIIESNLRLVMSLVKIHYKSFYESLYYIEYDDLFEVGCIGLIKAVDNYNVSYKVKFATYASRCILNEILMFLRKNKKLENVSSLNNNIDDDFEFMDLLLDDISIEDNYIDKELKKEVIESLIVLSDLEKRVVMLYFGLNSPSYSQAQISEILNISASYVSRILTRSYKKIKLYLNKIDNNFKVLIKK